MLRLMADENFNGEIVRGLLLRHPGFDIVRVQDVGLGGANDRAIIAWAADNERIMVTHDRSTVPDFFYERLSAGARVSGIFVLDDRFPIGAAIEELLLMDACSEQIESTGRVVYLPL